MKHQGRLEIEATVHLDDDEARTLMADLQDFFAARAGVVFAATHTIVWKTEIIYATDVRSRSEYPERRRVT